MPRRLVLALLALPLLVAAAPRAAGGEALSSLPPDRLAERIQAELAFAEGLLSLHPDRKAEWGPLVEKARALAGTSDAPRPVDAQAVAQAEAVLAPVAAVAKTYTVHNVGHAHIDMNWMWPWPETVAVTNDTFTTVLRLMDEFPDFRFTQSQASVYEIARRYNPALFERIKARVAEGRWEVAASQWVEGDKNLASGESIARHLLYTRRFMEDELGLKPEDVPIDWSSPTPSATPTRSRPSSPAGASRATTCAGAAGTRSPPSSGGAGPDGSRVLVNLETTWYLKAVGPENASALLAFAAKTGLRDWMNVYGVGDHGGGPTRRDIRRILEMDGWPVFPRFRFATTREFYAILEKNADRLPVLDRELNFEFTGCYTSQSQIKRHNRLGESRALDAEAAAVLALPGGGTALPGRGPPRRLDERALRPLPRHPARLRRARHPRVPVRPLPAERGHVRHGPGGVAARGGRGGGHHLREGPRAHRARRRGPGSRGRGRPRLRPRRRLRRRPTRWTARGRSSSSTRRPGRATSWCEPASGTRARPPTGARGAGSSCTRPTAGPSPRRSWARASTGATGSRTWSSPPRWARSATPRTSSRSGRPGAVRYATGDAAQGRRRSARLRERPAVRALRPADRRGGAARRQGHRPRPRDARRPAGPPRARGRAAAGHVGLGHRRHDVARPAAHAPLPGGGDEQPLRGDARGEGEGPRLGPDAPLLAEGRASPGSTWRSRPRGWSGAGPRPGRRSSAWSSRPGSRGRRRATRSRTGRSSAASRRARRSPPCATPTRSGRSRGGRPASCSSTTASTATRSTARPSPSPCCARATSRTPCPRSAPTPCAWRSCPTAGR